MIFIFLPSLVLPRETFLHPLCCLPRRKASHTIGRNILCHYATSTDDASCTDRDTFEDDAVSTHPDIVLNHYRCRLRAFVGSAASHIIHWMCIGVGYQDTRSYLYIVANRNAVVTPEACATIPTLLPIASSAPGSTYTAPCRLLVIGFTASPEEK